MSDYSSCPSCGHRPHSSLSVSHMDIFRCSDCRTEYCWKCPGSNGGHKCPRCSSGSFRTVGKCYAR